MPDIPRAFLLTFRIHGTWLPGDARGTVDRRHNVYGEPYADADPVRADLAAARLTGPPVLLDEARRRVVHEAIVDQCKYRGWELIETAVRSNHVHAVVGYAPVGADRMLRELKARATRWLREAGLARTDARIWAAGGSKRYLWTDRDAEAAASYVREGQDVPR